MKIKQLVAVTGFGGAREVHEQTRDWPDDQPLPEGATKVEETAPVHQEDE